MDKRTFAALKGPRCTVSYAIVLLSLSAAARAQHPGMPPGMTHEEHLKQMEKDAELKKRGAAAMGFDQDKTIHHFRLAPDGGSIEVTANDPADAPTLAAVRAHLKEIAGDFSKGHFDKPFATHGEVPPGVPTLKARRDKVTYRYEDLAAGGRVVIATPDARALSAAHEFLRYQIREHATGDPTTVSNR